MATLRGFATGRPVVVLSVLDDGAGFDPSASYAGHFGLGTIRERATAVDGRIAIDSAPGGGTTVTWSCPRLRSPVRRLARARREPEVPDGMASVRYAHARHSRTVTACHGRPTPIERGTAAAGRTARWTMTTEFFAYAVDPWLAPFWLPFGVRPSKDGVTIIDGTTFRATFGFLKMETALSNIDEAHITRNYRWWTAAGARRSWVDDGLTFGTNNKAGVCVHFRQPVPSPLRRKGHSALTVTVADVDALVDRLAL
jgi:hypothetical protein